VYVPGIAVISAFGLSEVNNIWIYGAVKIMPMMYPDMASETFRPVKRFLLFTI
jgi:hypothetical protein